MRLLWKIGAIFACIALVACGSDDGDSGGDTNPESTEIVASPTAAPPEMSLGNIIWSESSDEETGEPVEEVEMFTPDSPAITAHIEVTDMPAGTEFTAEWTINDQPIEGSDMHVEAQGDVDHGWVSFRFTREQGTYPTGQLGVVITSTTGTMREGSIDIAFP